MIISFTGHRSPKIGGYKIPNPTYDKIRKVLEKKLMDLDYATASGNIGESLESPRCIERAISGMAQGFDQLAAELCVEMAIPFIAALPCWGQSGPWPIRAQIHWQELVAKAQESIVVSKCEYNSKVMQIRNEWMVDNSDLLIACWDGSSGGTKNCIDYAKSVNKPIEYLEWK